MDNTQQASIELMEGAENAENSAASLGARVMKSLRNMATFSEALRFGGAVIVVASMSNFMLQDWGSANDIQHYFMLLMQSALLAAAGFAMSYLLKENKGARIFFGLGLISVVANFTILGALVYSLTSSGSSISHYPGFAYWVTTSPSRLAMTIALALAVMIPITRFGFMVMSRPAAGRLTAVYLWMNSLLLLPIRDTAYIGLLTVASLVVLSLVIRRVLMNENNASTPGDVFSRGLLYLPLGVLLGRAIFLYSPDAYLALSISLVIYLGLRAASLRLASDHLIRRGAELLSHVLSYVIAISTANILAKFMPESLWLPAFAMMVVAVNFELYQRLSTAGLRRWVHLLSGSIFAFSFALNTLIFNGIIVTTLGLIAGAGLMIYAWKYGYRTFMLFGAVVIFIGARYPLEGLIEVLFDHSWLSLAVIGSSAIVLASLIERHGVRIKMKVMDWSRGEQQES